MTTFQLRRPTSEHPWCFIPTPYCNEGNSLFRGAKQIEMIDFSIKLSVLPSAYITLVTENHLRRCRRNLEASLILRMTELRLLKQRGTALHNTLCHIHRAMSSEQKTEAMAVLADIDYAYLRQGVYILDCANILADILPERQRDTKPEKKRAEYHLGRASKYALSATLTLEQWIETLDHYNWRCAFCPGGEYEVLEHYIPLIHGGGTTEHNCIPACASCNSRKNDRHPSTISSGGMKKSLQNVQTYLEARRSEAIS